ncbi:barstar family protein [Apibacter raozihei]|uniref:barstar family protein n=1 Tax=Apibacter TaxID=1778601 RepID=UPI000FE2D24A|nr:MULTISPECIES: barstar family protein [Apibacter]
MKTINFDFNTIRKSTDFYSQFRNKFEINSDFVNNRDGLWDALTGMIELPVKIEFHNLNLTSLDKFQKLISLFEDAEEETDGLLEFSYFIDK